VKIYTRKGDDGTTGLLFGGRESKDSDRVELNGLVDEAQAAIGLARAFAEDDELNDVCVALERDLWVLMAEVATATENRHKLTPGSSLVTEEMVAKIETTIDAFEGRFAMPTEFVIPGGTVRSAQLDVARTVVRRAERGAVWFSRTYPDSFVGAYLNRLSDLLWMLARWAEGSSTLSRQREGK
jgi:cob(I)alamin adenosyltransferase